VSLRAPRGRAAQAGPNPARMTALSLHIANGRRRRWPHAPDIKAQQKVTRGVAFAQRTVGTRDGRGGLLGGREGLGDQGALNDLHALVVHRAARGEKARPRRVRKQREKKGAARGSCSSKERPHGPPSDEGVAAAFLRPFCRFPPSPTHAASLEDVAPAPAGRWVSRPGEPGDGRRGKARRESASSVRREKEQSLHRATVWGPPNGGEAAARTHQ
jgi:hypothetical protein